MIILICAACFMAWIFLLLPNFVYLYTGWRTKYDNLKSRFSRESLEIYFRKFHHCSEAFLCKPGGAKLSDDELYQKFDEMYFKSYGKRHYILPLVLLAVISFIGILFISISVLFWMELQTNIKPLPPIAASALVGSYVWVAFNQINRYRKRDFTPYDVYSGSLRFFICIPLGYAITYIFKDAAGVPMAFFLGCLPLDTFLKYGRRFVNKYLKIGDTGTSEMSDIEKLQNVNREKAERFRKEGISTMSELAYCDPVELTMRTNLNFDYITDCMSQALLWMTVEDKINEFRKLGLRGSYEVHNLYHAIQGTEPKSGKLPGDQAQATETLQVIIGVLNLPEQALMWILFEISEDPYTRFIYNTWC